MKISYKKQFALGIMLLLILLLVVEGIARFYEWFYPNCSFINSEALKNVDIFQQREMCLDVLHLEFIENIENRYYPENQHFPSLNINSFGFRGPEISKEKGENTYRIFVLGGSTIFGTGSTSDKTTIPGYLQEKFTELYHEVNVEVINAGTSGANSFTELNYIQNHLIQFESDMFIIYDGWNDSWLRDQIISNIESLKNNKKTNNDSQQGTGIIEFIQNKIKIYRTPLVIYANFFYDKDWRYESAPTNYGQIDSETAHLWEKNWLELCTNNKNKFSTIIVLQPILGTGNKPYSKGELEFLPKAEDDIETVLILNGMSDSLKNLNNFCTATFDFRNVFDDVSEPIYFDKGHMNDMGKKIIAEKMFDEILPIVMKDIQSKHNKNY